MQKSVHTRTSVRINTKTAQSWIYHHSTMERSFGQEISGNRLPGHELSSEQISAIIAKKEDGVGAQKIAKDFGVSRRVVYNTINRQKHHHTVHSLPRSGRPPILDKQDKRRLFSLARQDPIYQYKELRRRLRISQLSRTTIYEALRARNLTKWRRKKRPFLKPKHAKLRLAFTWKYRYHN